MRIRGFRFFLPVCGILAVPVLGQSGVSEAQNKLLARRAAEADAYRKLAEAVYGVQINSTTFVRDFVAESDEIRTGVDTFIKGVRLGPPRYYEDGVCEVDAEVTVEKLVTTLKQIHATHYKGRTVKTTDIEQIQQRVQRDVIQVTGSGAPRPELPPNLPAGVESVITAFPPDYQAPKMLSVPGIWKGLPPQARLMAERAARVDAMRKLLEQIKGLRLNSETLVRDFVAEYDEIRTQATGIVMGAYEVEKYLHHDELIVEVTMAVPVEKVIERIKELHTQHYKGRKVVTTDIVNVRKEIQRDTITATGSGVPPERFASQMAARSDYDSPAWLGQMIEAVGQAARNTEMPEAQGRLMAERAARMDGVRKLLEQVKRLQIRSDTRVADFVAQHDQVIAQVEGVLSGAIQDDPRWDGDVVSVRVSIPAADVWSVIHDYMNVVRRRG
jgi:hypothetical protein